MNCKQRTAVKTNEDTLQFIEMYVADVSAKTAEGHLKNVEELKNPFHFRENKAN